jgi:hypothetical protein
MEFSNHDELGQIEAALRSERPRLGGDVESAICGRIGGAHSGGGRRVGFAVVLTVGTLVGLSAFGGVGYANFGFFGFNPPHGTKPPCGDQYGEPGKSTNPGPTHPGYPGFTWTGYRF